MDCILDHLKLIDRGEFGILTPVTDKTDSHKGPMSESERYLPEANIQLCVTHRCPTCHPPEPSLAFAPSSRRPLHVAGPVLRIYLRRVDRMGSGEEQLRLTEEGGGRCGRMASWVMAPGSTTLVG